MSGGKIRFPTGLSSPAIAGNNKVVWQFTGAQRFLHGPACLCVDVCPCIEGRAHMSMQCGLCSRWWDAADVSNVHTHIRIDVWTHIYVDICMFSN